MVFFAWHDYAEAEDTTRRAAVLLVRVADESGLLFFH